MKRTKDKSKSLQILCNIMKEELVIKGKPIARISKHNLSLYMRKVEIKRKSIFWDMNL